MDINMTTSDVIAIAALIVSGFSLGWGIISSRKSNKISVSSQNKSLGQGFFEKIFFEDIVVNLPEALVDIDDNGVSIEKIEKVEEIINRLFKKMLFYKYFEPDFYNDMKEILMEMENILVSGLGSNLSYLQRDTFKSAIHATSEKMYKKLKEYYLV